MATTGTIYSSLSDAIAEASVVTGHTFSWKGQVIPCVLNVENATIAASKASFPGFPITFPKVGDRITIQSKDFVILAISNAGATFVGGGYVESTTPYLDDTMTPLFSIHYGAFVRG